MHPIHMQAKRMLRLFRLFFITSSLISGMAGPLLASGSLDSTPAINKVRPAAVAGSWYPGDGDRLAKYLDGLLNKTALKPIPTASGPIRVLVLPHAGYLYSGATAAAGIKQVTGRSYRRVVVMGPAHRKGFAGLSLPNASHYETPLGLLPLDLAAMRSLSKMNDVHFA